MVKTDSAGRVAVTDAHAGQGQARPAAPSAESIVKGIAGLTQRVHELVDRAGKLSQRLIGIGDESTKEIREEPAQDQGLFGLIEQQVSHALDGVNLALTKISRINDRL